MARTKDGLKVRKCGCIYYEHGPPLQCKKHEVKERVEEEKTLRKLVREQAAELDHDLTRFEEYESLPGKWTAYCVHCGLIVIVYDAPPPVGDQVGGWALQRRCKEER